MIRNCDFSANIGAEGGAISNGGLLDVESSLFYNNTAHREGSASGGGGAIAVNLGIVTLTNSTFVSNYSPFEGGAIANSGELTVTNCSFSYNTSGMGGAIFNRSNLTLRNSIIANSMLSDSCQGWGEIDDGGGNLRWPATDNTCVGDFGDPRLEPLADNGGPTMTMALPMGSAAIQLAMTNCPATDQRGMPRGLRSSRCDAGAYEWQGLFVFLPAVYKTP